MISVLLGLILLANVGILLYVRNMSWLLGELLEYFQPGAAEEQIGFRSETAPSPEEEEYLPETEYVPPGPNVYEEKKRK